MNKKEEFKEELKKSVSDKIKTAKMNFKGKVVDGLETEGGSGAIADTVFLYFEDGSMVQFRAMGPEGVAIVYANEEFMHKAKRESREDSFSA